MEEPDEDQFHRDDGHRDDRSSLLCDGSLDDRYRLVCEDKLATRGLKTCNVLSLFGLLNSETNMMNCIRRLIFYCIR